MPIRKIFALILFIHLCRAPESTQEIDIATNNLQLNQCKSRIHEHQLQKCFATPPTNIGTEGNNYVYNQEKQSDELLCMETMRKDFIEEFKNYETFAEDWADIVWNFLQTENDTLGVIAINAMKICIKEFEKLIHLSEIFNNMTKTNAASSRNVTSVPPLPLTDHQKLLEGFRKMSCLVEKLYNITTLYYRLYNSSSCFNYLEEKYDALRDISILEKAYQYSLTTRQLTADMLKEADDLVDFKNKYYLQEILNTNFTIRLLDVEHWAEELKNWTARSETLDKLIKREHFRIPLQQYIQPVVYGVIFVFGFVGNAVLMIVIARHRNMRTAANMLLLNLAVADMLSLLVNIPLLHVYFTSIEWQLGEATCKMYRFCRHLSISVSIYSIVIISVQKFIILFRLSKMRCVDLGMSTFKIVLMISAAWLIGCVLAIPHTIYAGVYNKNCYGFYNDIAITYLKGISLFDLITLCIVPVLTISISSTLSSKLLKKSVRNAPGETVGRMNSIRNRLITAKVLIAISVVSFLSYVPIHCFYFYYSWVLDSIIEPKLHYVLFFFLYILLFGNSCFNAVALCMTCKNIRSGFKRYLFCHNEDSASKNQNLTLSTT